MTDYNRNKVASIDLETGEVNRLPADASQLISYDLARKFEEMERESPSLSRKRKMDFFCRTFQKVGVDFQSNQPKYQAGKRASLDLYTAYAPENLIILTPSYAIAAA